MGEQAAGDGALTYGKAKAVDEALRQLSPVDAAAAERLSCPSCQARPTGRR